MDDRQLSKWASIAEILSSFAILVTLLFLVVETRQNNTVIEQNTVAARWTAIQVQIESVRDGFRLWTEDPQTQQLMTRAHQSYADLTEIEQSRCRSLIFSVFLNMDVVWYSYQEGILPEPLWEREAEFLKYLASQSSCGREVWKDANVSRPFRDYMERNVLP